MPESLLINDFSAGWTPGDDPLNSRLNGLLKMDAVELDQTGALIMSGGTKKIGLAYTNNAIAIFSKFLNGSKRRWVVDKNGSTNSTIYRDGVNISTTAPAPTLSRAAFGIAWNFVIICNGNDRLKDDGTTITGLGIQGSSGALSVSLNGAGVLTGTYDYVEILVRNDGNGYVGKSPGTTGLNPITASANKVSVDPNTPSGQSNESWIYRKGGNLERYYRVAVRTAATGFAAFDDNVSDEDALLLNEVWDEDSTSLSAAFITEQILEIVGPIHEKHLYFTTSQIYFSERNSPDSTNPNKAIKFTGTQSEQFLWATQVGENTVLVGTTWDLYILVGTFADLPDGYIDAYLRPLGCGSPPISQDVAVYNNSVVYMSSNGWVIAGLNGECIPLCPPNTDRLYRGLTLQGYGGIPIYVYPQLRYSCAIAKNKLWVRVPQIVDNNPALPFTYRMEVYDFVRQYWRPLALSPEMLFAEEDDNVIGFFNDDKFLKDIDNQFYKTLDNAVLTNQTVNILTKVFNLGRPRNRKDSYDLKFKIDTGNTNLAVSLYKDESSSAISLGNISSNGLSEKIIDISSLVGLAKSWQLYLTGALPNFRLCDISLEYDLRPLQVTNLRINSVDFGEASANKKRIRTWPIIIDTLGNNVTITPIIDGTNGVTSIANINRKGTHLHFFKTDVFGQDYAFLLNSVNVFEFYGLGTPEIVQILPIAKQFDQLGPVEFFKYGKIKSIELRILAYGTTIPYIIYFEDTSVVTGNLTTVSGVEKNYTINNTKTTAGSILRIELGPTAFNFHRFYARAQVALSGRESDMTWVPLEN